MSLDNSFPLVMFVLSMMWVLGEEGFGSKIFSSLLVTAEFY